MKYYYVVYFKNGEMFLKPFDTHEQANNYKAEKDQVFKKDGTYKNSKIIRKNISKFYDGMWL